MSWDVLSLGRFIPGTLCLGTFCPLGRFVCAPVSRGRVNKVVFFHIPFLIDYLFPYETAVHIWIAGRGTMMRF